ncbi:MAG: 3-oxoacyl-ACP synthase [Spirochaetes bacterium]|nr:MAG: 3-oxoacyl-ACP synthase [Spirochaetota bacterium]
MKAYIHSVGSYVPDRRISNHELSSMVDTSDEWIFSHTGIRNRHVSPDEVAASDLAVNASLKVLKSSGIDPSDIDLVLVATTTPDFIGIPSTACIVQHRVMAKNAGAMDISAACTGFIYGLETARMFIHSGTASYILVIGSEVFSKIVNWKDRNTCVLFGDGAGAAIVAANRGNTESEIIDSVLKSEGHGANYLIRPVGGTKNPFIPGKSKVEDMYIKMEGRKVYNFAIRAICQTIDCLLRRNKLNLEDVKYIVPHQANVRIIKAAAKRLNIDVEKFYMNIEEYANTSAASIPIAMEQMEREGLLRRGDTILTVGFGGGLTYGGNLIKW